MSGYASAPAIAPDIQRSRPKRAPRHRDSSCAKAEIWKGLSDRLDG